MTSRIIPFTLKQFLICVVLLSQPLESATKDRLACRHFSSKEASEAQDDRFGTGLSRGL
jgi:hypothetical protein